tara:strand:- start:1155 stop:1358 length:204 start_codon:yes stop_codon:yes gene_type:complete
MESQLIAEEAPKFMDPKAINAEVPLKEDAPIIEVEGCAIKIESAISDADPIWVIVPNVENGCSLKEW